MRCGFLCQPTPGTSLTIADFSSLAKFLTNSCPGRLHDSQKLCTTRSPLHVRLPIFDCSNTTLAVRVLGISCVNQWWQAWRCTALFCPLHSPLFEVSLHSHIQPIHRHRLMLLSLL